MTGVRALRREEIGAAAATLTRTFDDDPLMRWLLPSERRRAIYLDWFHRRAIGECASAGGTFTVEEGPEAGAMVLAPPGHWPIPILRTLAATVVPKALPPFRFVWSGLRIERKIHALHPPGDHVYVYILGVGVSYKRRGLGARMMEHAIEIGRARGCVVHLETANPVNLPFYRRFGLEVRRELTDHGGPPIWIMSNDRSTAS